MSRRIFSVLVLSAAFTGHAAGNVITNPSFESGLVPWSLGSVNPGAVFSLENAFGFTGSRSVFFGAASQLQPIILSQDLAAPLVNGGAYELSFWVHNYGIDNDSLAISMIEVLPNNNELHQAIVPPGIVGTALESWSQVVIPFVANANSNRIQISGFDNSAAFYLDEFSLVAIPAPGAGATIAAAGLLATRRRRRA